MEKVGDYLSTSNQRRRLSANDTIAWSQLSGDATALLASNNYTSTNGVTGTAVLAGANSLVAVVCAANACS